MDLISNSFRDDKRILYGRDEKITFPFIENKAAPNPLSIFTGKIDDLKEKRG